MLIYANMWLFQQQIFPVTNKNPGEIELTLGSTSILPLPWELEPIVSWCRDHLTKSSRTPNHLVQILILIQSIVGLFNHTKICTCHDSIAVMACAIFYMVILNSLLLYSIIMWFYNVKRGKYKCENRYGALEFLVAWSHICELHNPDHCVRIIPTQE